MKVNSKKVKISGIGWCYEITSKPKNKNMNDPEDKEDDDDDNIYGDVFEY